MVVGKVIPDVMGLPSVCFRELDSVGRYSELIELFSWAFLVQRVN